MQVFTEVTYEGLASALGLAPGLKIEVVEVEPLRGVLNIIVSGDLPSRTVTKAGFSPSPKKRGAFPDFVHLSYLTPPEG